MAKTCKDNHISWHESGASGSTGLSDRTKHVMCHESSTKIHTTGDVYEAQGFADLAMGLALATVSWQH